MADLIEPVPQALQPYQARQRYLLIDVRRVLLPRSMPGKKLRRVKTLTEVKMIVQEDPRSWFYQERQKGEQQGQAALLSRQLQHKFGTLTPAVQQRLAQASTQQLEVWSLNLLNAATLEQVFTQPQ